MAHTTPTTTRDKSVSALTKTELGEEAIHLLHECWGQAKASPEYQKVTWGRLQDIRYRDTAK